jgi:hypothetical protein
VRSSPREPLILHRAAWRALGVAEIVLGVGAGSAAIGTIANNVRGELQRGALAAETVAYAAAGIAAITLAVAIVVLHGRDLTRQRTASAGLRVAVVALVVIAVTRNGAVGAAGTTSDTFHLSAREAIAFEYLSHTDRFDMPTVGFLAVPSNGYTAFRILRRHPRADIVFDKLADVAHPAGRLYALCGLYRANRARFDVLAAGDAYRVTEVKTMSGCVMQTESYDEIVRARAKGAARLAAGETLQHWFENPHREKSIAFDIAGGSYPALMWEPMPHEETFVAAEDDFVREHM